MDVAARCAAIGIRHHTGESHLNRKLGPNVRAFLLVGLMGVIEPGFVGGN